MHVCEQAGGVMIRFPLVKGVMNACVCVCVCVHVHTGLLMSVCVVRGELKVH